MICHLGPKNEDALENVTLCVKILMLFFHIIFKLH